MRHQERERMECIVVWCGVVYIVSLSHAYQTNDGIKMLSRPTTRLYNARTSSRMHGDEQDRTRQDRRAKTGAQIVVLDV
jgi:hypothetical protein